MDPEFKGSKKCKLLIIISKKLFISEEKVYYASLDDLIVMKESAGRPKDLEDLKVLKILKEKRNT